MKVTSLFPTGLKRKEIEKGLILNYCDTKSVWSSEPRGLFKLDEWLLVRGSKWATVNFLCPSLLFLDGESCYDPSRWWSFIMMHWLFSGRYKEKLSAEKLTCRAHKWTRKLCQVLHLPAGDILVRSRCSWKKSMAFWFSLLFLLLHPLPSQV